MSNKTKLEFKPEMFEAPIKVTSVSGCYEWQLQRAETYALARLCQARFDAWLSEQVRVSGMIVDGAFKTKGYAFTGNQRDDHTHTALLVCIEEIQRKPCEHEPRIEHPMEKISGHKSVHEGLCRFCGIKLKATWEAV